MSSQSIAQTGRDHEGDEVLSEIIAELDQGCSDLAQRAELAEQRLETIIQMATCDGTVLKNALQRLANEQQAHDVTKRLLRRDSDTMAAYQLERDELLRRVTQWADEAARYQGIANSATDATMQLRAAIIAAADAIHTVGGIRIVDEDKVVNLKILADELRDLRVPEGE